MDINDNRISRRDFSRACMAVAASASLATAEAREATTLPGREVGRKFNADGTVKAFGGNTYISHIPQQGPRFQTFDALLDIYRDFPRHAFSRKVALTPPSSYHVTMFIGLNEVDRHTARWPRHLPAEMPMDTVTRTWLDALAQRPRLTDFKVRLEFVDAPLVHDGAPHLTLQPADTDSRLSLAQLRNELSELTGLHDADHDRYQFHMTFGYLFAQLDDREARDLQTQTNRWTDTLRKKVGFIELESVQFCRFHDMYAFEVLQEL